MKKLDSTLKNMALSLFLICAAMSAALASVYIFTKEPIEQSEKKKINDAIGQVVPQFDNNPGGEVFKVCPKGGSENNIDGDSLAFYPAYKNGKLVGTAISTFTNKGFSGFISVMVGILPDGSIYNTMVLEQNETPGLGSKMKDNKFHDQFNGKKTDNYKIKVKKDGGDVDAITAATISSRAYCDALTRAGDAYRSTVVANQVADTLKNQGGKE